MGLCLGEIFGGKRPKEMSGGCQDTLDLGIKRQLQAGQRTLRHLSNATGVSKSGGMYSGLFGSIRQKMKRSDAGSDNRRKIWDGICSFARGTIRICTHLTPYLPSPICTQNGPFYHANLLAFPIIHVRY